MSNKLDYKSLIIFVCAAAIRVYVALECSITPDLGDMALFDKLAVEGGLNACHAPLYPLFLRVIYSIFGNYNYTSVFFVQGIVNAFLVVLIYKLAVKICNQTAGIIAASICAIYPNFIMYSLITSTESFSLVLVVLIMMTLVLQLSDGYKASISAVLVGSGILLEFSHLFFVPGLFVVLRKRRLFLLILACILMPWTIRNAVVHQGFVPVYDSIKCNFKLIQYVQARDGWDTVDYIYHNMSSVMGRYWNYLENGRIISGKSVPYYISKYSYTILLALGLLGLARFFRKENLVVILPVLGFVGLHVLVSTFEQRFRVIIEPMLIVYLSIFIGKECEAIISRRLRAKLQEC